MSTSSYSRVNVGVAVATEDALLVGSSPSPTGARSQRSLPRRAGWWRPPERERYGRRSCRTPHPVSDLGMFGVRAFTAIVDAPQAAILAVGGVRREPAEDGAGGVAFRDVLTLTLSCDHRVVYGADGARSSPDSASCSSNRSPSPSDGSHRLPHRSSRRARRRAGRRRACDLLRRGFAVAGRSQRRPACTRSMAASGSSTPQSRSSRSPVPLSGRLSTGYGR